MEVIFLILIVVGVGVAIAGAAAGHGRSTAAWQAAAQRLGLRFEAGTMMDGPTMSGSIRGSSIKIDIHARDGEGSAKYTRYRLSFKEGLGLDLRLTRQGPLADISKKFGTLDIKVGDSDFDDVVTVKGRNPRQIQEFLTEGRRLKAVRFLSLYPSAVINDVAIECETPTVERNPDRLVKTVQRMVGLAQDLTRRSHEGGAIGQAPDARPLDSSERADAYPEEDEPLEPKELEVSPGSRPIELEELMITPDFDSYEVGTTPLRIVEEEPGPTAYPTEEEEPPNPDQLRAGQEATAEDDKSLLPAGQSSAIPDSTELSGVLEPDHRVAEPDSGSHDSLDVRSVAGKLFASGGTSAEVTDLFESLYKGREVCWSGKLVNVRSFRFDLVFGNEPGTRAEFVILDTTADSIGSRPVKAVVSFPPEAEEELRTKVDNMLTFTGYLISCDAFMKTLFLDNGLACYGGC